MEFVLDILQLMLLAYLVLLRMPKPAPPPPPVPAPVLAAVPPPPRRGTPWLCRTMEYRYQSGAAHDFHTNPNCPKHNTDMEFSELTREYGSLLSVTPLTFCHESTHLIED